MMIFVPLDQHGRSVVAAIAAIGDDQRRMFCGPAFEFRAALQRGVGQRFDQQRLVDRQVRVARSTCTSVIAASGACSMLASSGVAAPGSRTTS